MEATEDIMKMATMAEEEQAMIMEMIIRVCFM